MKKTVAAMTFGQLQPGDAFISLDPCIGVAPADDHLPLSWIPQPKVKLDHNTYCNLGDVGRAREICRDSNLPVLPLRVYGSLKDANTQPPRVPLPRSG